MKKVSEYDVVRLTHAIPEQNLAEGAIGAVVMVYDKPPAYEVEFCDTDGRTLALLTLREDDIDRADIAPTSSGD